MNRAFWGYWVAANAIVLAARVYSPSIILGPNDALSSEYGVALLLITYGVGLAGSFGAHYYVLKRYVKEPFDLASQTTTIIMVASFLAPIVPLISFLPAYVGSILIGTALSGLYAQWSMWRGEKKKSGS